MTDINNEIKKIQTRIKKSLLHIFTSDSDDDSEKAWLINRTSNDELKKLIPRLSVLSFHTLEVICQRGSIKGVDIAQELNVTKGAISKVTRRLLDYGLIKRVQRPSNLKEVYFSATSLGFVLSDLHQQFHAEYDRKSFDLLTSYDVSSLEIVAEFLEKLARLR